MGYKTKSDCVGDRPIEMICENESCDTDTFWTDETVTNTCPECSRNSMSPA